MTKLYVNDEITLFDGTVLELLRHVKLRLSTATLSNSLVQWRLRCVMLRFVAVLVYSLKTKFFYG